MAEMPLGFQIWVGKQQCGGHNLTLIGLTELLDSGWTLSPPGPPTSGNTAWYLGGDRIFD